MPRKALGSLATPTRERLSLLAATGGQGNPSQGGRQLPPPRGVVTLPGRGFRESRRLGDV